jgi:hypothetical protein
MNPFNHPNDIFKICLIIFTFILVSSCGTNNIFEGKILLVSKGDSFGGFDELIILNSSGKEMRFSSNGEVFNHYPYSHLLSHQLSGDILEIIYKKSSKKNTIESISHHNHDSHEH